MGKYHQLGFERALILEETDALNFITNGDEGHASEVCALGSTEIRAVDDPVVVAAAVKAVLLSLTVREHFSFWILLAWDWVGLPFYGGFGLHCSRCRCRLCGSLAPLGKCEAAPSSGATGGASNVEGLELVCELEDFVIGLGYGV